MSPISIRLRWQLTAAAGFATAVAGCVAPAGSVAPPSQTAHLVITNASARAWRLEIAGASRAPLVARIAPRDAAALEVVPGDCTIQQTLLDRAEAPETTRRFSLRLEAGQTYRWTLATLFSGGEEVARVRPFPPAIRP